MLILAGLKLKSIQDQVQGDQPDVKHLDISGNYLKSGVELKAFPNIETLIIDNNYFFSIEDFPALPNLITLSANKNNFNNLEIFTQLVAQKFPKVQHISLIKNPLCPIFLGEDEYQEYRSELVRTLKSLKNIDGTPVDPREADPNYKKYKKQQQAKLLDQKQQDEAKGTIEYNTKYQKPTSKTVKTRSEGNRFVKNNQL